MPRRGVRSRNQDDSPAGQEASQLSSESPDSIPAFFNTTYSPYRVSPLYLGTQPLDQDRFNALAKRLRDLLVGDVVRGVEVGLDGDDNLMARAGALEAVDLGWLSLGSLLGLDPDLMEEEIQRQDGSPASADLSTGSAVALGLQRDEEVTQRRLKSVSGRQALHISIRYESAMCTALLLPQLRSNDAARTAERLLRDRDGGSLFRQALPGGFCVGSDNNRPVNRKQFCDLPLLLVRMPASLRSVIIDFLSSSFDCRISPLRLGTRTLLTNLERWIAVSRSMRGSAASKDVLITLGFFFSIRPIHDTDTDESRNVDHGLKSMDIIIPASDIQRFRHEGAKLGAAHAPTPWKDKFEREGHGGKGEALDGSMLEEGWHWRYKNSTNTPPTGGASTSHPFTEALGAYVNQHLALNLFDSRTGITRIACGGFAMSESRLKLFSPSEKDPAGGAEHRMFAAHIQAVVDCLGDLLDRAGARF